MAFLSSQGSVDKWNWLDSAAKATGIPWCGWPREWSKSGTACRTCISFYSRIQRGSNKTKQLEHIEKQKRLISKGKLMEKHQDTKHGLDSVQKHIHKQYEELLRERAKERKFMEKHQDTKHGLDSVQKHINKQYEELLREREKEQGPVHKTPGTSPPRIS